MIAEVISFVYHVTDVVEYGKNWEGREDVLTVQQMINAAMTISFISLGVSLLATLGQLYTYFTDPKRRR